MKLPVKLIYTEPSDELRKLQLARIYVPDTKALRLCSVDSLNVLLVAENCCCKLLRSGANRIKDRTFLCTCPGVRNLFHLHKLPVLAVKGYNDETASKLHLTSYQCKVITAFAICNH